MPYKNQSNFLKRIKTCFDLTIKTTTTYNTCHKNTCTMKPNNTILELLFPFVIQVINLLCLHYNFTKTLSCLYSQQI